MITPDPLSAFFITLFLSAASDIIESHASFKGLEYPSGLSMALKRSDSIWL